MSKQKNLSPLELGHLIKYRDNQARCTLAELAIEMGYPVEVLESYLEKLGDIKTKEQPIRDELTESQQMVRKSFAASKGAIIMTEGTAALIENIQGDPSFDNPMGIPLNLQSKSNKSESAIFRGNKPVNPQGNPYNERRV